MGTDLRHIFLRLLDFESVVLFILLLPVHFVTLLVIFLFLVFLRIVSLNYEQKFSSPTHHVALLFFATHRHKYSRNVDLLTHETVEELNAWLWATGPASVKKLLLEVPASLPKTSSGEAADLDKLDWKNLNSLLKMRRISPSLLLTEAAVRLLLADHPYVQLRSAHYRRSILDGMGNPHPHLTTFMNAAADCRKKA
ncbi:hypothetical protein C8J57DRAFT_1609136 [Mycena rebaudengoi]|nr:hypothetical protein C8J57DRAFT_1609136 [Mycena rebaudengoi]